MLLRSLVSLAPAEWHRQPVLLDPPSAPPNRRFSHVWPWGLARLREAPEGVLADWGVLANTDVPEETRRLGDRETGRRGRERTELHAGSDYEFYLVVQQTSSTDARRLMARRLATCL